MVTALEAASYIYNEYYQQKGQQIDEMKLHKLLYFAQRESLIQSENPLFEAQFSGWKYGPILKEIREAYKNNELLADIDSDALTELKPIMETVFQEYASKDSWSLSRLSHGEYSWRKSREGIEENMNSDRKIKLEDIKVDAQRVKIRRQLLADLGIN